jgi:hypothetical protein
MNPALVRVAWQAKSCRCHRWDPAYRFVVVIEGEPVTAHRSRHTASETARINGGVVVDIG